MSGLAVRFHRDGRPVSDTSVWMMLEAIPYRATDGMWVHTCSNVAMGFAKMTITREEIHEQQPLVSPRTGCVIIADIRLDNRDELLRRLHALPATMSDAELVLHAYERWGTDAVKYLMGDFAFVIWDPRDERFVCARDTSGQRSLFYFVDNTTFIAASEIHQIFQDASIPVEPNEDHILFGMRMDNVFRNEKQHASTYYRGIMSVPAGHVMTVSSDSHRLWKYWELTPPDEIRYRSDDEYVEHFRNLLFTVVNDRLRSIYPVGAFLSGGLDSSSVVCVAHEVFARQGATAPNFIAFSSVFDGLDCDERPYIETVRNKYDLDVRYIPANGINARLQLEPQRFQESPNMALNADRATLLSSAQASGARVILTGDIADACVQGTWLVFDSLLRQGRLRDMVNHAREYQQALDASHRMIARHTFPPLLPLALQRRIMTTSTRRWLARNEGLLLPNWMPEPLRASLEEQSAEALVRIEETRRFANQTKHHESGLLYPPEVAGHPAPHSLQPWRPFADRRLHEFLLAIPADQKFNTAPGSGGPYARSKWILRRAMEGILPDTIRLRTVKTDFSQAYSGAIDRHWPLYEAAFNAPEPSEIAKRGYVTPDRFWLRLQDARAGLDGPDSIYLAHLIGIETWLRTFNLPRPQLVTIPTPAYDTMALSGG